MSNTEYSPERGLPASLEAERSILGALLLDDTHWPEAEAHLTPDHFSLDAHRRIYARMQQLQGRGIPIDTITLPNVLNRNKEIETVGGMAYLSSLIDGVPERPSIGHYVEIVRGSALLRGLINVAQHTIAEAMEHADEPGKVLARAEQAILQLADANVGKKPLVSLAEATPAAYDAMFRQQESGLTTAIAGLDERTDGGIRDEELWIIGGDPGSGKSAFMSQIAAENGRQDRAVDIWSIEMKKSRILRRMWCYESGLFYSRLKRSPNLLSPRDRERFDEAVKMVAEFPIRVNDASGLTPERFVAEARQAVLRNKTKLVMIDHIQIMADNMPGKDAAEKAGRIAGVLGKFAKDYCPVVALSQLTRQSKEQRGQRPKMQDLYGGRFMEANASVIAMIWRPQDGDGKDTGKDEILLEKNREGERGVIVPVLFRGGLMKFEQREARAV